MIVSDIFVPCYDHKNHFIHRYYIHAVECKFSIVGSLIGCPLFNFLIELFTSALIARMKTYFICYALDSTK